jgi:hypothetical protein
MTSVLDASSTEEPVIVIGRIFDALSCSGRRLPIRTMSRGGMAGTDSRILSVRWMCDPAARRAGGPPKAVTTVTLEALGVRTRWTLVARFNSVAERDISAKMGFEHMISQGAERMAEHLKAL